MDTTQTGVIIRDGVVYGGGASQAANVTYDKSGSKTSVQSELDMLNNNLTVTNNNMKKIKTYVGTDGKLHFIDATGADSVLPFKKNITKTLLASYNDQFSIAQGEKPWTYNASGIDGYRDLTADNFVLDDFVFRAASHATDNVSNNTSQIKTYDANSGLLRFSTMRTGKGWSMGGICQCNLYLIR